ncbi:MAG: hypothetical protein ACPIOQ_65930, partial [Promethearchaeia archaeon]
SKNIYDTIKSFNLGNLSELPTIPKYYQKFLFSYIIHISSAFSHVHKYDLIHGKSYFFAGERRGGSRREGAGVWGKSNGVAVGECRHLGGGRL